MAEDVGNGAARSEESHAQLAQSLLTAIRADQRTRWQQGQPLWVEAYLDRHPVLRADAEGVLDLIYNEVFLREQRQEAPQLEEYVARFPQFATELRDQFAVHRLLEGNLLDEDRHSTDERDDRPDDPPRPLPAKENVSLPGYRALQEIGRGGAGIVYKAQQAKPARVVAIKLLRAEAAPALQQRFGIEAEAVARLHHTHIVQIHEVGEHQGQPYLTLEYVEGGSLAHRLASGPLSFHQAAELTETLARAVHYAHQQGVVHRDLKPANVLLTADGTPKITDFGFAKLLVAGGTGPTQSEAVFGTPSYMAPEQAQGRSREAGPPADVYALGAILYEMVTGRAPFLATTPLETLRLVVAVEPVPPARLQPRVPRDLETICIKCLQKEASNRYASALALAEDVRRFLNNEPIQAWPVGHLERLWRWSKRNPVVASLAAAVFLLLAAVAGIASVGYVRARAAEQEIRRQWYAASISAMQQAWDTGQVGRLRTLLAETESYRDRGFEWYFFQRLCHLELQTLIGHRAGVTAVFWSPDGKRLATGSQDGTARVWDAASGQELLPMRGHTSWVTSVSWSPDGKRLATGSRDGTARLWEVASGRELLVLKGHRSWVSSVSWSPDGKSLATGSDDGTAKLWEPAGGRELLTLNGHTDGISSVSWSPVGKRLATGSTDGTVKVWDVAGRRELLTLTGRTGPVSSVSWSPDGKRLAMGSQDGTAKLWDAASGGELLTLEGHTSPVRSVSWSPDGKRLATASEDGTAKVWEAAGRRELSTLRGHTNPVSCVSWSPDGKLLATGSTDGTAKVWDADSDHVRLALKGHTNQVQAVSWSPDGNLLATASADGTARIWHASGGPERLTLRSHTSGFPSVSWSPDGKQLATGCYDGTVTLWDAAGGRELIAIKAHTRPVWSVPWSPDGKLLATVSWDATAKVWETVSGRELLTLKGLRELTSVSWSPDGKWLTTGSEDGTAKVWNAADGRELLALKGHTSWISSVSWSPDGKRLATGSGDRTAKVWDPVSGLELLTLNGHTSPVGSVSWSPDGKRLATGSNDGTAKVWETAGGRELLTLKGHTSQVWSVSWSPDGNRLATGSHDGTVKVWESAGTEAVQEWSRQDRVVQELLALNALPSPQGQGFLQTWLVLLPLPLASGESGAEGMDRQQLPGEARLRPLPRQRVHVGGRELVWQEHRSPEPIMDFNAVLGQLTERSVAYAACYLESDQPRNDLSLQVGSDDQAKVYLNGRAIYQCPLNRRLEGLDTSGPVELEQGTNVLLFKVVNESGGWLGCVRLVDALGRPAQGIHVRLAPEP